MNLRCPKLRLDKIGITEYKVGNGKIVLKLFDVESGEIFEDSDYVVRPYKQVTPLPRYAKCKEQALDFRSEWDTKYMSTNNKHFGDLESISNKHGEDILKIVLSLTKHVVVHNVCFIPRDVLVSIFNCTDKNLNRKLKSLVDRHIIQYETKGLNVPKTIKILINPSYFWYGSDKSRMHEWLSYWCSKTNKVLEIEDTFRKNEITSEIPLEYDVRYDIGVYDEKVVEEDEYLLDKSYVRTLTHDQLIYLIYGV